MTAYIDIYCERVDQAFWAEPVNAVTNAAFLIAAIAAFVLARRRRVFQLTPYLLILLIAIIGTGSFLFHTFATRWAMLADVIPIMIFQLVFIYAYARHVMHSKKPDLLGIYAIFAILVLFFGRLPQDWLNGSLSYAPALLVLLCLSFWHWRNAGQARWALPTAGLVFIISMTFRSIDMAICQTLPLGTHFLWHILNAIVLYLSVYAVLINLPVRRAARLDVTI
jgi:hypothetical protein